MRLELYMPRLLALLAGLTVLGTATACEEDPLEEPYDCELRTRYDVEGTWYITAKGTRSDCEDERDNGSLRIEAQPLRVTATPIAPTTPAFEPEAISDADAFVERIGRVDYRLELAGAVPDGVAFETDSNGEPDAYIRDSCHVEFELVEELPRGDQLRYHFFGYSVSDTRIRGEITGSGPGECNVKGTFNIAVR